jgi:hypothetical protein
MLNRIKNPEGERQVPIRWSEKKWTTSLSFRNSEPRPPLTETHLIVDGGFVKGIASAEIPQTYFFSIKTRLSANHWTISQSMSV